MAERRLDTAKAPGQYGVRLPDPCSSTDRAAAYEAVRCRFKSCRGCEHGILYAMSSDDQKAHPWNWSQSDSKMLLVTFAGTVVANVVTILCVGVAIIMARLLRPTRDTSDAYWFFFGETAFTLFAAFTAGFGAYRWRGDRLKGLAGKVSGIVALLIFAFETCVALMLVLAWVGIATAK